MIAGSSTRSSSVPTASRPRSPETVRIGILTRAGIVQDTIRGGTDTPRAGRGRRRVGWGIFLDSAGRASLGFRSSIRMRSGAVLLLLVPVVVLLAGCSQVTSAVPDGAGQAATSAAAAAGEQLTAQICAPVEDGIISADDLKLLETLIVAAGSGNIAPTVRVPLQQVVESGGTVTADASASLRAACETFSVARTEME